ncbi:M14 family metallopeptidase [Sphingomonas lutea]|uniref:M14 family metallopeptidase n=1 Tax=Sphingomonas lutea TaxID=1045317 RepID=A0A7G9SIY5_9SPHN|nr:M14 family metallopeptidase [Sphingomonas lutea]QNN67810.1 M14 family metallopeptidase [Sphingomonas lutea]
MRRVLTAFAAAVFATPLAAQAPVVPAPLPPLIPWSGASERLIVPAADPWVTHAERAGFATTPDYAQTRAWLDRLVAASPLLKLEVFGRTPQGRELYAIRASKPGPARKPLLVAQAGIHAGEIDGKDAGMMLLRDIALRGKDRLLNNADLVFVPIFNADGHERSAATNRPNQRGPDNQGWRTTAQNLNLNRDYLKGDTPEMRAMRAYLNRLDPTLILDLHVSDGVDYEYDITFTFPGWMGSPSHSPAIGGWLDAHYRPAITAALAKAGHVPGLYVEAIDPRNLAKGATLSPDQPRYSTGYGELARQPTVLVETHSLKPYRQRVLGTYILVEESLRLLGAKGAGLGQAIAQDRASRPSTSVLTWKPLDKPLFTIRNFRGVAQDTYRSAASGRDEVRWLGRRASFDLPVYIAQPDFVATLPAAWWVPATKPEVIDLLKLHGIAFEQIAAPRTVTLDMVRLSGPKLGAANEGHVPLSAAAYVHAPRTETYPAGSVRVPSDQPLGLLAAAMLEPESPDSLLAWNFYPEILQRTEYMEGYVIAPLADAMLEANPNLRAEFEAKLAADPKFAADGNARLAWFYERTPYYDARFLLYPVGRELKP